MSMCPALSSADGGSEGAGGGSERCSIIAGSGDGGGDGGASTCPATHTMSMQ